MRYIFWMLAGVIYVGLLGLSLNSLAGENVDKVVVHNSDTKKMGNLNMQNEEITQWISQLGEGQPGDNNEATEALIGIGEPVIPYLLKFLKKESPRGEGRGLSSAQWARLRAAHCLSQLRYPKIVQIILREVQRTTHPVARLIYAIYLTRHDIGKAVEVLVDELKQGEYTLPDVVITLKNIHSPRAIPLLKPLLEDSQTDVRLGAAEVLVSLGDASGESVLLKQLGKERELEAALLLPKKYHKKIIPVLKKHREHPDSEMRTRVAEKLADLGIIEESFELLLDALQREPNPQRRGGDGPLFEIPGIADRIISLIGHPDTYDAFGTQALRDKVIARWRRRWKTEGRKFLRGLDERSPLPGRQELKFGDIYLKKEMRDMRYYFYLAGKKLYEIGTMDGTFPPVGRLLGDQNGIWCHPIKVMDRFEYTILEEGQKPWTLTDCQHFVQQFASCKFHFARNGLKAERQDFVAEDEPALFSVLTLRNETEHPRKINLQFSGWVNIRPSWHSEFQNDLDVIEYQDGMVIGVDSGMEKKWGVVFGTHQLPDKHKLEDNRATLTYQVDLPAHGDTALTFLVLGEHEAGVSAAREKFRSLLESAKEILAQKEALYRKKILDGVKFHCSDDEVNDAFYCAKANLLMLSADYRPYFVAPFLAAGVPTYPQLFGCDTFYSIAGATSGGFDKMARGTLECLASYAQQNSGWVPHEVLTDGIELGKGNTQEILQFVIACGEYFQWTADREFLEKVYPLCKQSIKFVLERFEQDGDAYLEGTGLIEEEGMGTEKIDSACYLYDAFQSLAEMAESQKLQEEAEKYRRRASRLKERFNIDWWNASAQMWADSLKRDGTQRMDGYWSINFPMEIGIAEPEKAQAALKRIEKEWVNHWGCVYRWKPDISEEGVGVVHNNISALAAFMYGQADFGWKMLKLSTPAPRKQGMLGAFDEVLPTPDYAKLVSGQSAANLMQLWSSAPYIEGIIEGLAGIVPQAVFHRVEVFPQLPTDLNSFSLHNLTIGEHKLSLSYQREKNREVTTLIHQNGSVPLRCSVRILWREGQRIILNGKEVTPKKDVQRGVVTNVVDCEILPGDTATIRVE